MKKNQEAVADTVASSAEGSVEVLFGSLCKFMNIEPQKNPDTFIATSIGAIEYACVIARQCGVEKSAYMEAVNNVWGRVQGDAEAGGAKGAGGAGGADDAGGSDDAEGSVREQDEERVDADSPPS